MIRNPLDNCDFFDCPPCTNDVRRCPDGTTFVGRDRNNNCEFMACPGCNIEVQVSPLTNVPPYWPMTYETQHSRYSDETNRSALMELMWCLILKTIATSLRALDVPQM